VAAPAPAPAPAAPSWAAPSPAPSLGHSGESSPHSGEEDN
jgi:hypothetical protein